jgi:hypothetical protein
MDWIAILGAVGFGAIITKLLDVLWLHRVTQEAERRKWLRTEKLRVYAVLSKALRNTAVGPWGGDLIQVYDAATDALLLEEDAKVVDAIQKHLDDRQVIAKTIHEQTPTIDWGAAETEHEDHKKRVAAHEKYIAQEDERLRSDVRELTRILGASLRKR